MRTTVSVGRDRGHDSCGGRTKAAGRTARIRTAMPGTRGDAYAAYAAPPGCW
ncbi:hypothetical protein [Streptomyces mirabilis]|uniref:hypothetical protein n=1 Tax=Streptomyces mirabilis TaxID=68239 RepID=UPI00382FB73C